MMESQYKLRSITDRHEWVRYFLTVNQSHLSQSWHYGDAKSKSQGWKLLRSVITENEKPIALIQAWCKKIIFFTLIRISYGPLWLIENPSQAQIKGVFCAIKKSWGIKKLSAISISPNLPHSSENADTLKQLHFIKRKSIKYESGFIDLSLSIEELRVKLRQNWRNQLKSSEKHTLQFQVTQNEDDFKWILANFELLRKEKNFFGHPIELLTALYQSDFDHHQTYTSIVYQGEEKIAGMLFAGHGTCCVPLVICVDKLARKLNAGNFLFWNSVLFAKSQGYLWFDLGGTNNGTGFKTGLPHTPYQMIGEYIVL